MARWPKARAPADGGELTNDSARAGSAPPAAEPGPADDRARPGRNGLLAAERRDQLLARLHRDGKLVARDLAAELGLSEDSVRRDPRELAAAAGLCQRVYGGALPVAPGLGAVQAARSEIAPESKRRVGARAAQLIMPGSTAILDGGTTALEVVAALPPDLDARIITHSATTAAALASHPKASVLMLGGHLHKQSVSASGAMAAEAAGRISADVALLIITGIHPQEGLTVSDPEQAALLRILISRAADTYVMASVRHRLRLPHRRPAGSGGHHHRRARRPPHGPPAARPGRHRHPGPLTRTWPAPRSPATLEHMSGTTTATATGQAPASVVPGQVVRSPHWSRPGRRALVAADLAGLHGPVGGQVQLPLRLFWSLPDHQFNLDDADTRRWYYETVLREASRPDDLADYLDGATLVRLWPDLYLPKGVRRAWEERHPSLRAPVAA